MQIRYHKGVSSEMHEGLVGSPLEEKVVYFINSKLLELIITTNHQKVSIILF